MPEDKQLPQGFKPLEYCLLEKECLIDLVPFVEDEDYDMGLWERQFLNDMLRYVANGWGFTIRQQSWILKLHDRIVAGKEDDDE